MKKIINEPQMVVEETLEGFLAAYPNQFERVDGVKGIRVKELKEKVGLVIGGGSGHEPMFSMFVGENLADASANGNIFASPDPNTILQTAMSVECGKGILFVYGNYAGDNLNFDMAAELLDDLGVESRIVRVWDDIASAPKDRIKDRRGIAGDVFVIKIAGAATASGLTLDEAYRIAAKARDCTYSIGVALSGGTIPGEREAAFSLPDGEIEFGMGVHGEPGIKRMKMLPADEITEILLDELLRDSGIRAGDRVCTLVNGLGSTTLSELCIINRRLKALLAEKGIEVYDMDMNSYITCQEMAGASVSLLLLDDELKPFYDMPCNSPYYFKKGIQGDKAQKPNHQSKEFTPTVSNKKNSFVAIKKDGCPFTGQNMTASQLKEMLLFAADEMIAQKPYLTEVDSKIGDGDHGIGIEIGFTKVKEVLSNAEYQTVNDLFRAAGMAMLNSMGGASGVIFSTIFLGGLKGKEPIQAITPAVFADIMADSLEKIKQRGGAKVGDKTMVDAMEPACAAMNQSAAAGDAFPAFFTAAEQAALEGVEATKGYVAKFGRAKSLMERAVGFQDAGATSVALLFGAMRKWCEET